jgi:DNA mismatch endonuclease (patch repair protein)
MRAVKSENTKPEMLVRRLVHSLGYRFRLHRKGLPGSPDLVFPRKRKAIFVHGCFWHGHDCKRGAREPRSNKAYWRSKIAGNRERDRIAIQSLGAQGWESLVVWECETKDVTSMQHMIEEFLAQ